MEMGQPQAWELRAARRRAAMSDTDLNADFGFRETP